MYISNDLIDSVPLEKEKIIYPGYIRSFTRTLKEKHDTIIRQSFDEPEFIIHDLSAQHHPIPNSGARASYEIQV
jgi:hypothetical protein